MNPRLPALIVLGLVCSAQAFAQTTPTAGSMDPAMRGVMAPEAISQLYLSPGVKPDAAFGAYQRGYYLTALAEAKKRIDANVDVPAAMTLIGVLYAEGSGVRLDPSEAARWYRLASDRGDIEASFSLAIAYLSGQGVEKSEAKARPLLEKAAAAGHPAALYQLGLLALGGDIQNAVAAADYFRRAADAGDNDAIYALGLAYKEGRGVGKDLAHAADLLRQAADKGIAAAQVDYGIVLFNGEGVEKDEAGAARYFARAAGANNPVAMNRLARLYAFGRGVKEDRVEAMKWHILARAGGVSDERLNGILNSLNPTERVAVEEAVKKFTGR